MPETQTPTDAAPSVFHIARFSCLPETHVVEHWKFTQLELLDWLERKPTQPWRGTQRHPGWSPVLYDPPERARENIRAVYCLVLDYDKGKPTFDAVVSLWQPFVGIVYTTKSHDIDAERLRVVLPLSRPVTADEYDRLWAWADQTARRVELKTDGQAKDASRFWFMPTLPDRGEWRAGRLTGAVLDVDATLPLAETPALRLVTTPQPVTNDARSRRAAAYLARIPAAVSGDGGHTQTFNAVAHVMIGFDLDADTTYSLIASEYNPRCDPPWKEKELRHKIRSVQERCKRPRGYLLDDDRRPVTTTTAAAASAPDVPAELDVDWRTLLLRGKNGPRRGYSNTLAFVRHHPDYRGKWSLNTMTGEVWFDGRPTPETFVHDIRARADQLLGFTPAVADAMAAILTSAQDRPFHPIQQYLRSIDWDGEPRLSAVARDYFGSEHPVHAEMARRWMIGAVARALQPGCKLDTALMLHGHQGYLKSTFFSVLGGPWHSDSSIDISNKDAYQQIHAAWIYEFAELENVVTGRAESRLKAWLTSTHDSFRPPYKHQVERRARSVAICGTTNRQEILTDDTGSRRFWIIHVDRPIDTATLAECRDQLWAEAVCAYEAGEPWWFDRDLEREREELNVEFEIEDSWEETIDAFLATPTILEVTIGRVLADALRMDPSRRDRSAEMRVARVLKRLGWRRERIGAGQRAWVYRRAGQRRFGFSS